MLNQKGRYVQIVHADNESLSIEHDTYQNIIDVEVDLDEPSSYASFHLNKVQIIALRDYLNSMDL